MSSKRPLRILLVEDSEHDVLAFQRAWKKSDSPCKLAHCSRADDALQRLKTDAALFDLVVCDYQLPGMTGLALFKELRASGISLPFVMLTGGGSEQLAVQALKAGVDDYLIKDAVDGYAELLPIVLPEVVRKHDDRSARRRAEEELRKTFAELERSNKELELFASIASHDLRAPLSTIGGFAQLLYDRYKDKLDEKAQRALTHMIKGTQNMEMLISDLLAYARVTSGARPFGPVSCKAVIDIVLANLLTDIEKNAAVITFDDLPVVYGDEMQFVQLFQNLFGNAIKYRGEQPPRIHVTAKRLDDPAIGWLFSVTDNGIGLDQAHAGKIFEIFKRLHHGDKYSGTGIGLAVCKKIVERHNGSIWVESEPGKGSTFFFTIPDRTT